MLWTLDVVDARCCNAGQVFRLFNQGQDVEVPDDCNAYVD